MRAWGMLLCLAVSPAVLAAPPSTEVVASDVAGEASPEKLRVLEERIRTVQEELARSRAVARGDVTALYLHADGAAQRAARVERGSLSQARDHHRRDVDAVIRRATSWLPRAEARLREAAADEQGAREAQGPPRDPALAQRSERLEAELRVLEVERDLLRARLLRSSTGPDEATARGVWAAARAARERLRQEEGALPERITRAATTDPSP